MQNFGREKKVGVNKREKGIKVTKRKNYFSL